MSKFLRILIAVLILALVLPTQLGGPIGYLMIDGNSMEPDFSRGDLVVTRTQSDYAVGDIVAYRHPDIGAVFHRIVAITEHAYEMKGDNNGWVDSYYPSQEEIIGKFAFRIPFIGSIVVSLRSPDKLVYFSAGASLLLVASVITGSAGRAKTRKQQRSKRKTREEVSHEVSPSAGLPIRLQDAFMLMIALLLLALFFGMAAFIKPTQLQTTVNIPYEHIGTFSYDAAVPENLYDGGTLQSGEPIFRRINDEFEVSFNYHLASSVISELSGIYRVVAEVSVNNGWSRSVELIPNTAFEGSTLANTAVVDVNKLQNYVDVFEQETGIAPQQYFITVRPEISLAGQHGEQPWFDTFAPSLDFSVNDFQIELRGDGGKPQDSLSQVQSSLVQESVAEENSLHILGLDLNIHAARLASILLVAAFASMAILIGVRIRWLNRQPEFQRISGLYGGLIIPLNDEEGLDGNSRVTVSNFENLIRLAQQEGTSVLQHRDGQTADFYVQAPGVLYHYRVFQAD